ncbi:c-type cytochrome [Chlorobaculum sp. MV4-Y]|uniref:c-type cytochrome n=1 Tax=Chlorobaculum sp. MV4-Y TaxID=2976335 RepID=UPI0021AF0528|nr:c-type cytochrome [Chlorobaculum sp. MV4-Y]UWX57228.1 c-type cytochrome [Chlorobaculum sp. MV4-Y]
MSDSGVPHEGHNKIPKGWMTFFIGVIIFLVVYIARFTPAISGWSFYKQYDEEMKAGAKAAVAAPAEPGMYIGKADAVAAGKSEFETTCAACHMADASGGIGPNLKVALKYGSTPADLYESIANGRPNGMPPFGQQLGNDKIYKIIAFIESLRK